MCLIEDCGKPVAAKGYCKQHYYAERRSGRLSRTLSRNNGRCCVESCDRPARKKLLCDPHYKRLWRSGLVTGSGKAFRGEAEKWLRANVNFQGADCLEWPFGRSKAGYGALSIGGHEAPASRHMAQLIYGHLPRSTQVRHTCDNPPCCNPNHLVLGTALQNHIDSVERNRHVPPPWKPGSKNGAAKLTDDEVFQIRKRLEHETGRKLAQEYGISEAQVSRIKLGKSWSICSAH